MTVRVDCNNQANYAGAAYTSQEAGLTLDCSWKPDFNNAFNAVSATVRADPGRGLSRSGMCASRQGRELGHGRARCPYWYHRCCRFPFHCRPARSSRSGRRRLRRSPARLSGAGPHVEQAGHELAVVVAEPFPGSYDRLVAGTGVVDRLAAPASIRCCRGRRCVPLPSP
jgi:hypothetical protein